MTVEIPLTQGFVSLVDEIDAEWALKLRWHALIHRRGSQKYVYALRNVETSDSRHRIQLHREVIDAPPDREVDHINHDTLDNRRANLRLATRSQNCINRRWTGGCGFRGVLVRVRARGPTFQVRIQLPDRRLYLGTFDNAEEAARVYDEAAQKYFGEFAILNFAHRDMPYGSNAASVAGAGLPADISSQSKLPATPSPQEIGSPGFSECASASLRASIVALHPVTGP